MRKNLFCWLVISLPLLFSCNTLTDFFISDEDEIAMGAKFKAQILADTVAYPQYKNNSANHTEVINYINAMGQKLAAAQADRKNFPFTFTIIANDTMINAFAIPGGHVFVYSGLLKAANSGAEVAGVIAHEVGHITMRHGASRLAQQAGIQIVNQILFGSDSSATAAIAGLLESMLFLKFSRDDENQADGCAVRYTMAAQYNPYGIMVFFNTLKTRYGGGMGPFEVFSTHPNTDERINKVQTLINNTPNHPPFDGTDMYQAEYAVIKSKM